MSIPSNYVLMDSMISKQNRPDFIKKSRSIGFLDHEVFVSVKQLNIDKLEESALKRNTPGSDLYQKWLTSEEVGAIRNNPIGSEAIINWFHENNIEIKWMSPSKLYMRVITSINNWERLLHTSFYNYEDQKIGFNKRQLSRAENYAIPHHLRDHIHSFYGISEFPARISKHSIKREVPIEYETLTISNDNINNNNLRVSRKLSSSCNGYSTIQCLNQVYNIASNTGSSTASESVFETNTESFSPTDLTKFQQTYGLTTQAAIDIGGQSVATCNTNDAPTAKNGCFEGNLDIQYIMGMAQVTTAYYYYVDSGDPFV